MLTACELCVCATNSKTTGISRGTTVTVVTSGVGRAGGGGVPRPHALAIDATRTAIPIADGRRQQDIAFPLDAGRRRLQCVSIFCGDYIQCGAAAPIALARNASAPQLPGIKNRIHLDEVTEMSWTYSLIAPQQPRRCNEQPRQ